MMMNIIILAILFSIKTFNFNLTEAKISIKPVELEHLTTIAKEQLDIIEAKLFNRQKDPNSPRKSKFRTSLLVSADDPLRLDHLNKFMSEKIQQYSEDLNVMVMPEFRSLYEKKFRMIRQVIEDIDYKNLSKIGSTSCSLEIIAHSNTVKSSSVCPWHWVNVKRENLFPFVRSSAVCNCNSCLARTVYDNGYIKASRCLPTYSLMPALIRDHSNHSNQSDENKMERWWFTLEEIPTSCFCSVKLNIYS